MLKENWRLVGRLERVGDALLIVLSFFVAYYGRDSLIYWNQVFDWSLPFAGAGLAPIRDYFIILIFAIFLYLGCFEFLGAYGSMRLSNSLQLLKLSVLASLFVFFGLAALLFLLKIDLSRSFIGLFCFLVALFTAAERYTVLSSLRYWRKRGRNFRNLLVCGIGEQAVRFTKEISSRPELGFRVLGFVDLYPASEDSGIRLESFREDLRLIGARQSRIFHGKDGFEFVVKEYSIDEVLFTDVVDVMPLVEQLIIICAEQGIRTTIAADLFSVGLVKSGISYFGSMPLIHFQTPPGDKWELSLKRQLDVLISSACLLILAPLFAIIAVVIKLSSPGPVFFSQKRIGLNGRSFVLYKFRSMRFGAEKDQARLQSANEMSGPVFKVKNDPRVTSIGRILRRFSLDELPQFWNVLKGEMSLVGPRPPVPGEVSMYERKDRRRLSMRPGMTCTWQVSGRNEIKNFDDWVKLDLEYIDNWSLGLDFVLLFKTIPAVLLGTGAR